MASKSAGGAPARGSAAAAAAHKRRRNIASNSNSNSNSNSSDVTNKNLLRFYSNDEPGLKLSPTAVLVMSLCFIAAVAALHVIGKLFRRSSSFDYSAS